MKYIYTGVFFDANELFNKFNCNIGANRLARSIENPHVTFTFKPDTVTPELFGKPVKFRVIGYACDGKNQSVRVEVITIPTSLHAEYDKIKQPHITISVSADGKSVDTGKMKFEPIENPFCIIGKYGAYTTDGVCTENPVTQTVSEFCRMKTQATELCALCDGGWIVATVWIDYEDIFRLPESLANKPVKSDEWGTLPIVDKDGNKMKIPVHLIYT